MNNCYLVAFNKSIRHIEIDESKININQGNKTKLEYIDTITGEYDSDYLRNGLFQKGIIESIDTPIYVAEISKRIGEDKKRIELYNVVTKETKEIFEHSYNLFKIFKEFHELYRSNNDFKELAKYFMDETDIEYMSRKYSLEDRNFVPRYEYARKMKEVLEVYKKYQSLDAYKESGNDYHENKDEIITLLEPGNTL